MKLLIVEDEQELSKTIESYFEQEGNVCEVVGTLNEAREKVNIYEYDCIVLDINLPDGKGLDLIKTIQDKDKVGVLILSANQQLEDKLEGLNLGADDYLVKPFHLSELNARLKSIIRRKQYQGKSQFSVNEISVNIDAKQVDVNNQEVELTKIEYKLLLYFLSNKNRVVTKSSICEYIYGDYMDNFDSVDFIYSHIKNLRKKLISAGCEDYVKTVYGVGYKFKV